ncbi:hypothetical protein ATI61_107286 [Archangium gephyra]|uniref:Lipoprotein n=1 Tax=Archangium gephyra TaxID=48 RepID=A0ABX9JYG8_9BACT|nr:hypothetical protein [Archangium gephyra]REG29590.1 hypothetical protein ATI61_107286 [Archangium gephyra]
MKRRVLLLALAVLLYATACVSFVDKDGAWEGISPSRFMFKSYVPPDAAGPGGWKAARIIINLARQSGDGRLQLVPCQVQVEVPEANYLGSISDALAQTEAAKAADAAAEIVLTQGLFSAEMCGRFHEEMRKRLEIPIPGARVRKFIDMKGAENEGSAPRVLRVARE